MSTDGEGENTFRLQRSVELKLIFNHGMILFFMIMTQTNLKQFNLEMKCSGGRKIFKFMENSCIDLK